MINKIAANRQTKIAAVKLYEEVFSNLLVCTSTMEGFDF